MKRTLTLYLPGPVQLSTTVEHDEAERLLAAWRTAKADPGPNIAMIDGTPVFHVALGDVVAISDEIA